MMRIRRLCKLQLIILYKELPKIKETVDKNDYEDYELVIAGDDAFVKIQKPVSLI